MTVTRATRRAFNGALASGLAATVCYWLWTSARAWAGRVEHADPDGLYAGFLDSALATLAGVATMPVLVWLTMRVLGERGIHLLLLGSTVSWLAIGGHVVETRVGGAGVIVLLAVQASLGGVLAACRVPVRRARSPSR